MAKKKKLPKIITEVKNRLPQPVNYAFQKNISYSQMMIYYDCKYRWKLQYKDKLRPFTSSIHTVFGTALHTVIQDYLDKMYNESITAADKLNLVFRFNKEFIEEYQTQYKKNNNQHFSSAEEMREFFEDGVQILEYFKKRRGAHFSKRGTYLVGCELPVIIPPDLSKPNLLFTGYLDVVLYNETVDKFEIIDIKSSTKGWGDWQKKDDLKKSQLIIYKKLFSEQYGIPLDKIEVKFFILKRKIWEDSPYPMKRIQEFIPAHGKSKINFASKLIDDFINNNFSTSGKIMEKEYPPSPSKSSCMFCPFLNTKECTVGVSS
jgi:hypothetical protein